LIDKLKVIYLTAIYLLGGLTLYGVLQHFNLDFLPWKNDYSPIILMTGNPDFAASLLGLLVVISFAALFINISKNIKYLVTVEILIALLVIYWTKAWQGIAATIIGVSFVFTLLVWRRSKKLAFGLIGIEIIVAVISLLGMLQIGPLSNYLYKISITDRGYNWRAAISMFKNHPWTGVGLDNYASYFLQYRDEKYPLLFGYKQTVTNAHNVFLELFATGGIFLGLSYLALIIFIGIRAFKVLKNVADENRIFVGGLVAGWLVFLAQSVISVDTLVISIWGWVIGGAIVAISYKGGEDNSPTVKVNKFKRNVHFQFY
jgi:O-antigen ligase